MPKTRKAAARIALALLTPERFVNFIRSVRGECDTFAVGLMNENLDAGHAPEDVLLRGDEYGFLLAVDTLGTRRFRIAFGCQAGPLAGDGGEWEVLFDEQGQVASINEGSSWIS